METYKLKIREFRKQRGITQKELAHRINISQSYLSDVENGIYDIKVSLLIKISDALEVAPEDLIEYENNHNYYI